MQLLWALAGQEPQEQVLLQQVPQEEIMEVIPHSAQLPQLVVVAEVLALLMLLAKQVGTVALAEVAEQWVGLQEVVILQLCLQRKEIMGVQEPVLIQVAAVAHPQRGALRPAQAVVTE